MRKLVSFFQSISILAAAVHLIIHLTTCLKSDPVNSVLTLAPITWLPSNTWSGPDDGAPGENQQLHHAAGNKSR